MFAETLGSQKPCTKNKTEQKLSEKQGPKLKIKIKSQKSWSNPSRQCSNSAGLRQQAVHLLLLKYSGQSEDTAAQKI